MLRLSKSSRLSAIHLITLLALPAASQDVIWEFPTSGTLFGVTLNYHDVVIAKWTSTWDNATIYAWAPQNATQQYPVSCKRSSFPQLRISQGRNGYGGRLTRFRNPRAFSSRPGQWHLRLQLRLRAARRDVRRQVPLSGAF